MAPGDARAGAVRSACCDAAMVHCAPAWPATRLRLHVAPRLGYKPASQRIFLRLLACTDLPCRSPREPSHERSKTSDAQGHSRLAGGKHLAVLRADRGILRAARA